MLGIFANLTKEGQLGLFKRHFMHFVVLHQLLVNIIKYTIDELAALLRTVFLSEVDVFVDSNFWWYSFKEKKFANAHSH